MKSRLFDTIDDIIDDLRQGRMVIMIDDESRENEGDLVLSGQCVTPQAINFMVTHARGLVCTAITAHRAQQLGLSLMVARGGDSPWGTAFTQSVDACRNITTGISTFDRATTIQVLANPHSIPSDLVQPGRSFPLIAKPGGVLERRGHTEASVDLVAMAGHDPTAVICEILRDDGTMARRDDLFILAKRWGIRMGLIEDLVQVRLEEDRPLWAKAS